MVRKDARTDRSREGSKTGGGGTGKDRKQARLDLRDERMTPQRSKSHKTEDLFSVEDGWEVEDDLWASGSVVRLVQTGGEGREGVEQTCGG